MDGPSDDHHPRMDDAPGELQPSTSNKACYFSAESQQYVFIALTSQSLISTIAAVHKVVFNGKSNLLQWRSFDPIHMLVIFKDHNNGR
ncbi:hypothetical protein T03_11068 [Trichinella britovi]|uniref:Uncharacterized protein n=1 Tax=Trichinella britovi TaxID=45882 RepID=A0A0V1CPP1_TRIBR|nr:hypothetical protein T03_11068 [Trichinella britovi]